MKVDEGVVQGIAALTPWVVAAGGLTWAGRLEEREQGRTRKRVLAITAATAGTGASSILAILAHRARTGASAAELVDRAAWAGITVSLIALAAYGWAWLKA